MDTDYICVICKQPTEQPFTVLEDRACICSEHCDAVWEAQSWEHQQALIVAAL